jgi:hypothetical protein
MSRHLTTIVFAFAFLATGAIADAAPLGTAFTYQGQLKDGGIAPTGLYDFEFKLFDAASGGSQVGSTQTKDDVGVASGLFVVSLDFGAAAFVGNARFVEIGVRPGASAGAFTSLPGRQELTPAPNAIYAGNSGQLNGQAGSYYTNLSNMTGTLAIANGGTGATTAAGARSSLGAAPEAYSYTSPVTIDAVGPNSVEIALAIGSDGFPIISYNDSANGDLKVAHCLDRACSGFQVSTLDTAGFSGSHSSIAIGTDGLAVISYAGQPGPKLKMAHCNDVACSSATISIVDPANNQLQTTSISIDPSGFPAIAYHDNIGGDLRLARCTTVTCSAATLSLLDSGTPPATLVGRESSLTFGSDGFPVVAYEDIYNLASDLRRAKVAHCGSNSCPVATITILDSSPNAGGSNAIIIGLDGLPLVAYSSSAGLKIAHCSDLDCATSTITGFGGAGAASSISIGVDGFGIVTQAGLGGIRVLHCSNAICSAGTASTLVTGTTGRATMAIGLDGFPVIAYVDPAGGGFLKVAHCTNVACSTAPKKR